MGKGISNDQSKTILEGIFSYGSFAFETLRIPIFLVQNCVPIKLLPT